MYADLTGNRKKYRIKSRYDNTCQSEMVSDAGKSLSRQIREVCVPEYDTYVFAKLAAAATANGNYSTTAITKANAYEQFLIGEEFLGNHNVPEQYWAAA